MPRENDEYEHEEREEEEEVRSFDSLSEWIDWVVDDYAESKKDEAGWTEYKRDPDELIYKVSLSKLLKKAEEYMDDDRI